MSKFGAHVSGGGRNGFGQALQQCFDADSPVPVLFSVDQDLWPDVEKYSPATILIFRTQVDGDDNPPNIYQSDPVTSANDWYGKCKSKWLLNRAHYYAPSNERNPNSSTQDAWIDLFDLRMMQLAEADGFHLALHGDSMGTPDYSQWQNYKSSLEIAAARGHILTLHEPIEGDDLAFRYRKVHQIIEQFAPGLKIAISECYGNLGSSASSYVSSFYPYDAEAMRDSYMLGFAAYQLGGDENWAAAIPQWADYVASTPEPPAPPDEYVFDHWHVNGLDAGTSSTLTITLDAPKNVTAVYRKKVLYPFKLSTDPPGLTSRVTQTPAGSEFPAGTEIKLTAA